MLGVLFVVKLDIRMDMKLDVIDLEEKTYMARVEMVKDQCMLTKMIVGDREKPKLIQNENVEVLVYNKGLVYSGKCTVLGVKEDKVFCRAVVTIPKEFKKVERRKFFRFPTNAQIEYVILPKEQDYLQVKDIPKEFLNAMKVSNAIDISGGGIKIFTEEAPEANQQILLSIFIPHEIKVICSVVRIERDIKNQKYKTSLRFEDISERSRDRIIEYIFEIMRESTMK